MKQKQNRLVVLNLYMKKHFSKLLINLIIALFLEVIVFNITSYRVLLGNFEKKEFTNLEFVQYDDEKVILKIDNLDIEVGTVKLNFDKNLTEVSEYRIGFSDETSSRFRNLNSKQYIPNNEKSKYMPVYLSGKVNGILITVNSEIYDNQELTKVTINEKIPFEFNIARFLIIVGILLFIYLLKNEKCINEEYSNRNFKQEIVLLGVLAIFFVILGFINQNSIEPDNLKIYNKKFVNAIYKGQLYLDDKPSEKFLNLVNPYDDLERSTLQRGKDYLWDTSYYNGKFYVYFGILPLLVFFLPYYAITKSYLDISIVVFILSIFILILIKEILLKIVKRYFPKISFKFVLFSLIIICSGSLVLYANGMSRIYELAIISGLYCVLQGIYFILKSIETDEKKYFNIFLGALFLSLSVACRPTDLFASILIVPYLIKLLLENLKIFKNKKMPLIKLVLAVAIPYLTVGILLMCYNYARFENPLEFGAKYQLTIVNMMSLKNRIFAVPTGIVANLFSIPNFIPDFPFITNHNKLLEFYGYYYIENMIGGLFIIAPICFMNFLVFKVNKKMENKELKIIINSLIIVGTLTAILSIMMAGSNQRYLIDYAWMLILSGILIFLVLYNNLKTNEAKNILKKIFGIITVFMFLIGVLCGIVSEKENMKNYFPETYYKTKYTICFWE